MNQQREGPLLANARRAALPPTCAELRSARPDGRPQRGEGRLSVVAQGRPCGRVYCSPSSSTSPSASTQKQGASPASALRQATGPVGLRRRSAAPAPQSKPVTPASRLVALVAPSVASGLG